MWRLVDSEPAPDNSSDQLWAHLGETIGAKGRAAHLFSWVPPAFESIVEQGIYVNPEQCIQWLDDWTSPSESSLIDALRSIARTQQGEV